MSVGSPKRAITRSEAWGVYGRLLEYARPYWRLGAVAVVAMAIGAASQAGFAAIIQYMVDESFIEQDDTARRVVPLALIGLFLVHGLANFVSDYGIAWVGRHVVKDLRQQVFEHYLRLPAAFFDRSSPGMLLAKLTYDIEQVARAASHAVVIFIRDLLTVVFLVGYMVYISGWLALIFFGLGPVLYGIIQYANKRFRRTSRRIQGSIGSVAQIAEDGIRGQGEVKIFGGHAYEAARFEHINERNRSQQMRYIAVKAVSQPLVQFVAVLALALILYLATMDVVMEEISPGALISFVTAMMLLMPPVKRIVGMNSEIQRGIAAGESVFGILDTPAEPDHGTRPLERALGRIRFDHVTFAYGADDGPVLHDVTLAIEPGETVALVGRSGSGKTTLASLLPRFYEPGSGEILLDGQPVRDYRLGDLRHQMALVGQQVVLFNDTLANNIRYGVQEGADMEAVRAAARAANALEFIERLPDGFETVIGENGVMLSGGQRQRVAIARALLKNAPILILDEATSALDSESEQQIQGALDQLMEGRTTLVIAHRLSTIENADRIVVLDQGRVVEEGSHADLMARQGHYHGLHQLQFGGG